MNYERVAQKCHGASFGNGLKGERVVKHVVFL